MLNLRAPIRSVFAVLALVAMVFSLAPLCARAQGLSGTIQGTVIDPSDANVPGATVEIANPVSGFMRQTKTDTNGSFAFTNIPFNPYHLTVSAQGFDGFTEDVDVKSSVPLVLMKIGLKIGGQTESITVSENASDLLEVTPEDHTDVDRSLIEDLPLESQSSSVSSLITLSSPGVVADSNGLFHGLGDHAENSFSVDGQPITDQQSKVFSNQIPSDSIQSLEVIEGAPPAEYGGKTSVIVNVTTRSGLGQTTPHGEITTSYGSFGTATENMNAAFGGSKWGDFISLGGLNTGRFLDGPEFAVLHDHGNEENAFNRADYKLSDKDTVQLNLEFTRSWFQNPNTWDQQLQTCTVLSAMCNAAGTTEVNPLTGAPLGPTDQRSKILTYIVAPTWTRLVNSDTVFSFGAWVRHDQYNYYPSNNLFSDLGPLQAESVSQLRFLTNAGGRADLSYVKGIHIIKVGATYEHTFLNENDVFGIIDPGVVPSLGCAGTPAPGTPCAVLPPIDLTNGGHLFRYGGHADIKEFAVFGQDQITKGPWSVTLGLRVDTYNGLDAAASQVEPRGGVAYNIKKTNTVLRASYARTLESPFNEDLILSGTGCSNPTVNAIMTVAQGGFTCTSQPLVPGFRNEFHAGLQQAFGKYFVLSGEYIWKYTHNAYDFNVFGTTPIFLPIEWKSSKIPGYAIKGNVPEFHGFTAFIVMSHVNARFFPGPNGAVAGIGPPPPPGVFRIDHDEQFATTTHFQYQPFKRGPWFGFNWRYDSGLVSGATPCLAATATCGFSTSPADGGAPCTALTATCVSNGGSGFVSIIPKGDVAMMNDIAGVPLTADQEFEAGLTCNGVAATPTKALPFLCPGTQFNSTLLAIPLPGTENDDHNPQRIAPRHLFDLAIGDDDIFHKSERYKWSARFEIINLANTVAVYNFLSTFSGTHYVSPRTLTGEIGFHF
jgi:hypothetical protein